MKENLHADKSTIVIGTVVHCTKTAWTLHSAPLHPSTGASSARVKVVFECVNEASLTTHVQLQRSTTAAEVTAQAQDLFAGSFPQKMRGVHIRCTVNGYTLVGPLTLGDVQDATHPRSSTIRVVCRRATVVHDQHSSGRSSSR